MIQKTLRGTIQLLGGLGAGLAIVVVLLAWRLTSGPISLAFLSPYIQEAANREAAGFTVEFDDTILTWAGWERTLDIRVINIRAKAPGGQVLATVPEVSISLSIGGMFHGLVAPRSIELFGPALHLTRHADGHFGIESDADGASGALVADLLARLAAPPNPDRSLGYLSRVSIHRGSAMVNDIRSDMVWFAPSVEATFERDAKGINAEVTTDVRIGDDFVKAVAIGRYHPKDDRVDLGIEVSHLVPAKLANASAIFEPLRALDLPIHGTLVTSVTGSGTIESVDFDLTADAGTLALPAPMAQNLPITSATVSGRLDGINRTWEIDELNLVLPDGATLVLPEANGYAAPLASVAAAGRFDERTGRMEIERLNLDLAGPKLSVRATVDRIFDSPAAGVSAVLTDMPIDSVGKYWPKNWGPDIREWIVPNMSAGMVKETRLRTTLRTKDDGAFELIDVAGTMKIDNATIDYFAPLPKATHAYGTGVFSHEDFTITVDRGEAAGLQVKGGTLHFKDFQKYDQTLDIDLLIHGPFRNALKLLDQKPLGFAKDLGIDPETAKGTSATNLHLDFPLIDALTFDGVNVSAAARLTDVALPDIVLDRDVTNGDLEVRVDKTAMEVTGKVDIGTVTADLKWKESFDKKVAQQSAFRLAGTVDDTQWIGEFGLDFPPFSAEYLRGAIPFEILWQTGRDGSGTLDANLDLAKATLTIPFLDWSKPPGVAGKGHAQLTLKDEKVTGIPAFDLSAADLDVGGSVAFRTDGTLDRIDMARVAIGRTAVKGTMIPGRDNGWTVALHGDSLDATVLFARLFDSKTDDSVKTPVSLSVDIGRVWIGENRALGRVKGSFARQDALWRSVRVEAEVNDGKPLRISVEPHAEGKRLLSITSEDAGAALRVLDYYSRISGGRLELSGEFDDTQPGSPMAGRLKITDFRVVDAPPLARVLSLLALTGIVESLQGEGIKFSTLDFPFTRRGDIIEIKDARASGTSIGLTASGTYQSGSQQLKIQGTIVPAYALNAVFGKIPLLGDILTGGESGGGVFAATYSITGDMDKTTVRVNPLSALAPGFLRNLFGIFDAPEQADTGTESEKNAPAKK